LRDRPYSDKSQNRWVLIAVGGATFYQAILCAMNTFGFPVSVALLMLGEVLIIASCIPLLLPRLLPGVVILASLLGAMFCAQALLKGGLDIKSFRDVLIPIVFYWAGRNVGSTQAADRLLKILVVVILIIGFIELWATDFFTQIFDVFGFYLDTGRVQEVTSYERESKLQLNGIRPDGIGRTLLPQLLSNHRVSSVFLEPVSLGNFATVVVAWALAKGKEQWRTQAFFLVTAVVLIVLTDSRFALLCVTILIAARLMLNGGWATYLVSLIPLIILAGLVLMGIYGDEYNGDDYAGRFARSGRTLLEMSGYAVLGVDHTGSYHDYGYSYVLANFGLISVMALWIVFWLLPMKDEEGMRFRASIGIYVTLILCISGNSVFAMKTAGVVWFLIGIMAKDPARPLVSKAQPEAAIRGVGRRFTQGSGAVHS